MDASRLRGTVIPNPAQGLHVLLVDHDPSCLTNMASVLQEQSYKVTTTVLATIALSLIRERGSWFDLVITEVDMPGISGFKLLNQILLIKQDISVILMSSKRDSGMAKKALDEGACFFFFKPVSAPELIKVWQHVFRKRGNRKGVSKEVEDQEDRAVQTIQAEKPSGVNEENVAEQPLIRDPNKGKAPCSDDGPGSKRPKNVAHDDARQANDGKLIIGGNDKQARDKDVGERKKMETGKKRKDTAEKPEPEKKSRLIWTPELHGLFLKAVAALGEDNAHPKSILEEMNIPELSHRHIASHLQKYRRQLNKIREVIRRDPPVLESNMTRYPSLSTPSLSMRQTPSIFDSNMTGYLARQPPTMHESKTTSIFDTFFTTNYPAQQIQSSNTPRLAPRGCARPNAYLNEGTAHNQMDTLNKLVANPSNSLPKTSNHQNSYANFGNQEVSQLNHVQYSADQGKGKQVLSSFGGYNDNHAAPADDSCRTNVDALMEAFTKKLADALGADDNLRQDVKFLARYNNVVPQKSSHQEPSKDFSTACEQLANNVVPQQSSRQGPSKEFSTACEDLAYNVIPQQSSHQEPSKEFSTVCEDLAYNVVPQQSSSQEPFKGFYAACEGLAPIETDFNFGEHMPFTYEDLAMIFDDPNVGSGDIKGSSPETDFNIGEQMAYSNEDLAVILDDPNVGSGGITGSSSEPPKQPLQNVVDDDDALTALLNKIDFPGIFEIFPDIRDGALELGCLLN